MARSFLSSSCKALSLSFLHRLNTHRCKPTAGPWSCVPSHLEAVKRRWASKASQRSSCKPCTSVMGNRTRSLALEMETLAGKLPGI